MLRSKSRSQIGGGGANGSGSPSPRPVSSAAASGAGPAGAAVKNILKNVESHVRVTAHAENVSVASTYTALRLRVPRSKRDAAGDGLKKTAESDGEWTAPFTVSRVHKATAPHAQSGGNGSNSGSSNSTFAFYSDVIAPCVSNACAGQSYLFLFTGAPESGRSQTLYGCPSKSSKHATSSSSPSPLVEPNADGNERGVVELAAIDLLERVQARERTRTGIEDAAAALAGADAGSANALAGGKENRVDGRAAGGPAGAGSGLVVTFSAFTTRGEQMIDTITRKEVRIETFPPPLGSVPLPSMHLLNERSLCSFAMGASPASTGGEEVVAVLPEKKYLDTSCIIQFQVYACVDGAAGAGAGGLYNNNNNSSSSNSNNSSSTAATAGKRSMATLTFVDAAAFRAPLCKEVVSLVETVRRVAGLSDDEAAAAAAPSASSQPNQGGPSTDESGGATANLFGSTKLTSLLEPALTGYVTLVSVTTISGREDLLESTSAALSFAHAITRIHQVFLLLHICTPRWLFEAGCALESLRDERERCVRGSYAQGIYDYYKTAARWLLHNVDGVEGHLQKLIAETAVVRTEVEREVQTQERTLQDSITREEAAVRQSADAARDALQASSSQFGAVKRLDEEIANVEQKVSQVELKASQRVSEMRIEINGLEAKRSSGEKELSRLRREHGLFKSKGQEVESVIRKYAEDLAYAQVRYASQVELQAIGCKRRRLEQDLETASHVAHRATDSLRSDRERRSLVSRLTTVQQRVDSLRSTVHQSNRSSQ